jgi:hypothetical protein
VRGNGLGINERFPGVKGLTERHPRWGQTLSYVWLGAALAVVAILTVNVAYGFSGSLTESVKGIPIPLPASFVQGLKYQFALGGSSSGVYFAGQIHPDGLWYKLPASLLIKTPIPLLLLLGASLISMAIPPRKLEVEWLLGAFIGCFLLVFSLSSVDGGIRYVLPIYPFLFVLVGRLVRPPSGRWKALALSAGAFWFLISSLNCFPHYLAYCNELIGGSRNGYKYFAGPNLDWGQDLRGLKDYMDEEGIETIQLAYYGSADAAHYGIDYDYLPSVGLAPKEPGQLWWYEMGKQSRKPLQPQKGKIAISATLLAAPRWMRPLFYDDYAWLRDRKPIEQIGHTILIYEIDEAAAD